MSASVSFVNASRRFLSVVPRGRDAVSGLRPEWVHTEEGLEFRSELLLAVVLARLLDIVCQTRVVGDRMAVLVLDKDLRGLAIKVFLDGLEGGVDDEAEDTITRHLVGGVLQGEENHGASCAEQCRRAASDDLLPRLTLVLEEVADDLGFECAGKLAASRALHQGN